MTEIRIDQLLKARRRTFYWLAKEAGISHTTLWRLKKGKALGINFATLEKICEALDCQPGDMFAFTNQKSNARETVFALTRFVDPCPGNEILFSQARVSGSYVVDVCSQ